jgi:hypothetical protein
MCRTPLSRASLRRTKQFPHELSPSFAAGFTRCFHFISMACRAARFRARFDSFLAGCFSPLSAFSCIDYPFVRMITPPSATTSGEFHHAHDCLSFSAMAASWIAPQGCSNFRWTLRCRSHEASPPALAQGNCN